MACPAQVVDSRRSWVGFTGSAIVFLTLDHRARPAGQIAFPRVGFAVVVMWPTIFSRALNSVESGHGSFSGILCTGIDREGRVPPSSGDSATLRPEAGDVRFRSHPRSRSYPLGLWARPLVADTISSRKKRQAA